MTREMARDPPRLEHGQRLPDHVRRLQGVDAARLVARDRKVRVADDVDLRDAVRLRRGVESACAVAGSM